MAKEDLIETTATVTEVLPDARYRVKLDNGYELIAYTNGKMRKHHIRILAGDKVSLEISPYDMTKGRITFRHIEGRPPVAAAGGKRQVIASVKEAVAKLEFCVSLFSFVRICTRRRHILFLFCNHFDRLILELNLLSGANLVAAFGADFPVYIH